MRALGFAFLTPSRCDFCDVVCLLFASHFPDYIIKYCIIQYTMYCHRYRTSSPCKILSLLALEYHTSYEYRQHALGVLSTVVHDCTMYIGVLHFFYYYCCYDDLERGGNLSAWIPVPVTTRPNCCTSYREGKHERAIMTRKERQMKLGHTRIVCHRNDVLEEFFMAANVMLTPCWWGSRLEHGKGKISFKYCVQGLPGYEILPGSTSWICIIPLKQAEGCFRRNTRGRATWRLHADRNPVLVCASNKKTVYDSYIMFRTRPKFF